MKVALLVCDHVADEFVDQYGTYVDMFQTLLPSVVLEPYFICDYFFPEVEAFDVFIATGSKKSVYDSEPWITHLLALIQEVDDKGKKFIGLCFGHQAIAQALGGAVEKSEHGYLIGVHSFQVQSSKSWMNDIREYKLLMLCQDQVKRLPEGSEVLASSAECPVAMFTVNDRLLGIQGHPEFSKGYNQAVFENRLRKVSPEKVEQAIESFLKDPDNELMASWIMGFLNN